MPDPHLRRQAFALAADLYGRPEAADVLRDRVGGSLRGLTDGQWLDVIQALRQEQSRRQAPHCTVTQWQRIQYLRRHLNYTEDHLRNLMQLVCKIDQERFLDSPAARDLITALEKIARQRRRRQEAAHA